jgi:hypothetical protein
VDERRAIFYASAMVQDRYTRYTRWRRRLAPIGLVVALAVLAHETCSRERAGATLHLVAPGHVSEFERVTVELMPAGKHEPIATFSSRSRGPGSGADEVATWRLPTLEKGMYDLRLELVKVGGQVLRDQRSVELRDGADITVDVTSYSGV